MLVILQSCTVNGLKEFTNEEKSFIENQMVSADCELYVDKDYDVIKNNASKGHLHLRLEFAYSKNKLCLADSAEVAKTILPFALGFEKIMDKRSQYDSLTIETSIMNRETERLEFQTCGKYFSFHLNNMKRFKYKEFIGNRKK